MSWRVDFTEELCVVVVIYFDIFTRETEISVSNLYGYKVIFY